MKALALAIIVSVCVLVIGAAFITGCAAARPYYDCRQAGGARDACLDATGGR